MRYYIIVVVRYDDRFRLAGPKRLRRAVKHFTPPIIIIVIIRRTENKHRNRTHTHLYDTGRDYRRPPRPN